jgi:hypothetical protein
MFQLALAVDTDQLQELSDAEVKRLFVHCGLRTPGYGRVFRC